MKLRPIKLRITLLNIMLAIAVFSITLAICRPKTELWPTYLAATWLSTRVSSHDPAAHETFEKEITAPDVIRAALADQNVAGLPRIKAATDRHKELLKGVSVDVHPPGQHYWDPTSELIRVMVESQSASEAVLVRDALVVAYLAHRKSGTPIRGSPALPELVPHPLFDRPWKFRAATATGLLLTVIVLIVPISRSKRFRKAAMAALAVGVVVGGTVWWLVTHPESHLRIGTIQVF